MGLVGGVAAPAIERIVERDAGLELFEIVIIHPRQAERSREQPGRFRDRDRAARYRRRAPSLPAAASAGVARPNSSTITSKVQSSPRWLQNTFSMSKGAALKRSPTATTSDGATNRNTAFGIDEAPDQPGAGDAVDLRPRAGHPDGAALRVARRQFRCRHQRQLGRLPALEAAFERLGFDAECRSQAAVPCASFSPRRQTTMAERPENSSPQSAAFSWLRLTAPGISRGSAAKSSSVRTSISAGIWAVPIRRASLSDDIVVGDDMVAPS